MKSTQQVTCGSAQRSTLYRVRWLKIFLVYFRCGSTPYRVRWLKVIILHQWTALPSKHPILGALVEGVTLPRAATCISEAPHTGVRWLKELLYLIRQRIAIRSTTYWVRWLKERTGMKSKADGGSTPYRVRWLKNKAQGSEYDYVIEAPHTGCVG